MEPKDRNLEWKDIWIKKGLNKNIAPLLADGYDLLTADEYDCMVFQVTRPIGLIGNENILECGCGAGAFLASLLKVYPTLKISGVDYSPTLLEKARGYLNGDFFVADMTDLGFLEKDTYDHTLSFGTLLYLSSEEAASQAISEMMRITRPGGMVYIGEIPDAAKRGEAESIRKASHQSVKKISSANPDHLYLPKEFFKNFARATSMDLRIIDHTEFDLGNYQAARYRYSVYLTIKRK
ncbi:MAG: class I SAM-dependent methyltransferase [Desulfobacteraceae bacterium]|nr:MAG: class I SAM-dependent methyltransferase [Desulfobacteraceae bacterium]